MKKGLSWGTGIVVSFIVFAVAILVAVYIAMTSKVDLVSDNYYEKELKYQDHIDVVKNAQGLEKNIECSLSDASLTITFPRIAPESDYSGFVYFFRPSDKSQDFTKQLALDSLYTQSFPTGSMIKGKWLMQITWKATGREYYHEQPVMIQ